MNDESIYVHENEFLDLKNMQTYILAQDPTVESMSKICSQFSNHGWCELGNKCKFVHNMDFILDHEAVEDLLCRQPVKKKELQNKIQYLKNLNDIAISLNPNSYVPQPSKSDQKESLSVGSKVNGDSATTNNEIGHVTSLYEASNAHHSGYDAFMTGYCFATYINDINTNDNGKHRNLINRVYITSSKSPFWIHKSAYATISSNFKGKLQRILQSANK